MRALTSEEFETLCGMEGEADDPPIEIYGAGDPNEADLDALYDGLVRVGLLDVNENDEAIVWTLHPRGRCAIRAHRSFLAGDRR